MPFDTQGNFTRVHNWENDRQNDIEIMSDRHDEEDDNFSEALNECFLRDGRVSLSGNLNAGNFQIKNVAQALADNDAVNLGQVINIKDNVVEQLRNIISTLCYIGDVKPSLQGANHGNWLLCNGQEISRTYYSELFDLIGTRFGVGDGINTFNIPDYRGKFLRGLGGNSAADIYTTQEEGLPDIVATGGSYPEGLSGADASSGAISRGTGSGTGYRLDTGGGAYFNETFSASGSNAIYGASNHVTPINQAVNWFIKAKGE